MHRFALIGFGAIVLMASHVQAEQPAPKLGVQLAFQNGQAIVTSIIPNYPAPLLGIEPGDVIVILGTPEKKRFIDAKEDADAFLSDLIFALTDGSLTAHFSCSSSTR